jgi:ribosomal protein L32
MKKVLVLTPLPTPLYPPDAGGGKTTKPFIYGRTLLGGGTIQSKSPVISKAQQLESFPLFKGDGRGIEEGDARGISGERKQTLARGFLGKHCLDAGWGKFFQVLEQCCLKRGVFFLKIDSKKTSQICPYCPTQTGKKELSERVHSCLDCGYTTDRDVAAAQVVLVRGLADFGVRQRL